MKVIASKNDPPGAPAAGDPPAPPAPAPASSGKKPRPLVPPRAPQNSKRQTKVLLTAYDGKIQWDQMTPEGRKAFEDLFKNPEFLKQYGLSGKKTFTPEQCKHLYTAIGMVYQTMGKLFLGWPPEVIKLLAYSEEQKNALSEPTAGILDRMMPAFLSRNSDLVVFLTVFVSITQCNFAAAQVEAQKIAAKKKPQASTTSSPAPTAAPGPRIVPQRGAERTEPADQPAPKVALGVGAPPVEPATDSLDDFSQDAGEAAAVDLARSLG